VSPAGLRSARFAGDAALEACARSDGLLERGATGSAVGKVQQALMDLGHVLCEFGPDGVFGDETCRAVVAFQTAHGLDAQAVVRSDTMARLDELFAGEPAFQPPPGPAAATAQTLDLGSDSDAQAVARRAVDIAVELAGAGSHFLAGAAGARPGGREGTRQRPASVELAPGRTEPGDPAVFAARSEDGSVCAGRFDAGNGGMAGGRPLRYTDTDFIVYLAGLAALPEDRWKPFFRFYSPRRVGQRLLWGEDCRAQQHFDGPGLVNWCVERAAEPDHTVALDMTAWATDGAGTHPVALDEPDAAGDVVLRTVDGRFTHIGLLVGDGHVVLAEQPSVGVVTRRFSPGGWAVRRRLGSG